MSKRRDVRGREDIHGAREGILDPGVASDVGTRDDKVRLCSIEELGPKGLYAKNERCGPGFPLNYRASER